MKVKELIEELNFLDAEDEVVIVAFNDIGEQMACEPNVVGRNGWDNVSEIHLGELISG